MSAPVGLGERDARPRPRCKKKKKTLANKCHTASVMLQWSRDNRLISLCVCMHGGVCAVISWARGGDGGLSGSVITLSSGCVCMLLWIDIRLLDRFGHCLSPCLAVQLRKETRWTDTASEKSSSVVASVAGTLDFYFHCQHNNLIYLCMFFFSSLVFYDQKCSTGRRAKALNIIQREGENNHLVLKHNGRNVNIQENVFYKWNNWNARRGNSPLSTFYWHSAVKTAVMLFCKSVQQHTARLRMSVGENMANFLQDVNSWLLNAHICCHISSYHVCVRSHDTVQLCLNKKSNRKNT